MVARPADLEVEAIRSADPQKRLRYVRSIKNAIIGNNSKKREYLQAGAVPCLLEVINGALAGATWEDGCQELLVQSCTALGSFACGIPTGVEEIISGGGIKCLTSTLDNADVNVVHAGVRSLKLVCQRGSIPCDTLLEQPVLLHLVSLLSSPKAEIAEDVACVFARICRTPEAAAVITNSEAIKSFTSLLLSPRKSSQTAALDALSCVLRGNTPAASRQLLQQAPVLEVLLKMMKDRSLEIRLMAASCCTYICTTLEPSQMCDDMQSLEATKRTTLATLHRLLAASAPISESVPPLMAKILEDNEELQKVAHDAGAIQLLAGFLTSPTCTDSVKEGVLRALANLCMARDEGRKQLIEGKVLPHIVSALGNENESVRSAGAMCIMALTRSVRALRSNLLESEGGTKMAEVLCKLLQDENKDVQVNATAAVCNLVLEFSSVKDAVLEKGGLQCLAQLTGSMIPALRLHSMWALRNMAYKSDTTVRHSLMAELHWCNMCALLNDQDVAVQEQAICLLRNLCMESRAHISAVFEWAGSDLLAILEEKLDPSRDVPVAIASHALYTVVNILTGSEQHKETVLSSNLPVMLIHYLRDVHGAPELRLPAIWCIINFTWPDNSPGLPGRVRKLLELGVDEHLKALRQDESLDVRERVKTALDQLQ